MKKMSWSLILLAAMACNAQAQRQEPAPTPPPFGDDAPPGPPPPRAAPFGQDPERRQEPPPGEDRKRDLKQKAQHLEAEIHKLESAIESKDATPEQREKWRHQLNFARNDLQILRAKMESEDERLMDPRNMPDRLMARLREIEDLLKKGVGIEDQRELMAERRKIQDELQRRGGPPGPPMDPEMAKRMEEMGRLERDTQELGAKLRRIPAENKDERTVVLGKLGEAVTKLFDLREEMRAREVDMLKRRLEELTKMLDKRKANRNQIIDKRIKQLSGEADELDW